LIVAQMPLLSYDVFGAIRCRGVPWQDNVGEFGDKFRKAREKKEISLDDVSNVTKIGARMLRAIEEEHFDQLPGGVFNKGFIRAYAKHLGLNDEEAVSDYLACLRQAQIDAQQVWEPEASVKPGSAQRQTVLEKRRPADSGKSGVKSQSPIQVEELPDLQLPRADHVRPPRKNFAGNSSGDIPWRILAVATIVVVLAGILWIRHSRSEHTAAAGLRSVQAQPAEVPAPIATPATESLNQPSNPALPEGTARSVHPSAQSTNTGRGAQSSVASTNPSGAAPATSPAASSAGGAEENGVTTSSVNQPIPKPSSNSTALLKLVIRAQETSWISVQADGQTVSQETLIAPAHVSVHADREIVARIGNAAGVTFLWNGQEIPADGAEAEVKTFVFDANGTRVIPSAPVQGR
jgi:cytoskeletal protein RodZ